MHIESIVSGHDQVQVIPSLMGGVVLDLRTSQYGLTGDIEKDRASAHLPLAKAEALAQALACAIEVAKTVGVAAPTNPTWGCVTAQRIAVEMTQKRRSVHDRKRPHIVESALVPVVESR